MRAELRRVRSLLLVLGLSSALPSLAQEVASSSPAVRAEFTVRELVDKANKVLRGDSSHARVVMTITTPEWTRSLDIEAWNQGRGKAFILIHAPAKEKGTTTLRRAGEMWMWMPRVERIMKVPPAMMHSSWQGSDFTYEDIVKADSIVKDYTHKTLKKTHGPEYEIYLIEALPKPDAPVVWGKVHFTLGVYPGGWVIPLGEEDYSERGELIRSITLTQIKSMDGRPQDPGGGTPSGYPSVGRLVPTRLECRPTRHPGRRTVLDYKEIDFDVELADSFFSLSRLQK
jgi:hypothetical protein